MFVVEERVPRTRAGTIGHPQAPRYVSNLLDHPLQAASILVIGATLQRVGKPWRLSPSIPQSLPKVGSIPNVSHVNSLYENTMYSS